MSETEKVFVLVGVACFFFVAGLATGYSIYVSRYHEQLTDHQAQRIEDQGRIKELENYNSDLRNRQRYALGIVERTAINLARKEAAEAAVTVSFDAAKQPTSDGYNLILCTLTLKAFDTSTGELFANVQDRDKTITRGGEYGIEDGVARAAIKVGPRTVERLTKKIVERFSTKRAKFVTLIFRNTSVANQDKMEGILDAIGWKYRVGRQTGNYMELEIFSEADPTSVRKVVRTEINKAGLPLKSGEMIGSRVIFDGKETGGY